MREQTAPEHPSEAHERAALARGAFVTSTATDDLAIQAEDCIPERKNFCLQMVSCFGEHIHQPVTEFGQYIQQEYSVILQVYAVKVSSGWSELCSEARFPGGTTGARGASLVRNCWRQIAISLLGPPDGPSEDSTVACQDHPG
jgi:hypothetical protein